MAWFHSNHIGSDGRGLFAVGQTFHGTSGDDTKNGTANDDTFKYGQGGHDTLSGKGGDDVFQMGAALDDADRIDGGSGFDTVSLNGDYSGAPSFGAVFTNVEKIVLAHGFDYNFGVFGIALANSATLIVDGGALGANDTLAFFGTNAGHYDVTGGAGGDQLFAGSRSDVIHGGGGDDYIRGFGGADLLYGGGGRDNFDLGSPADSTGPNHDTIFGFDARQDVIGVEIMVTGVDPSVENFGTLSQNTFNGDMADWVGKDQLHAHHAILFTPQHGDLGGHTFLIVDRNGNAGYQANKDYVVELVNGQHLGDLHANDFTGSA